VPSDIRIIRAHEFIRATPEGNVDFDRAKKVLVEVALASGPFADYDVILDVRNVQFDMSEADLWDLAAELHELRQAFSRRTAVLVAPERSDYAGYFAILAQKQGFDLSAFTHFADAMEWLDQGEHTGA
jgi:hypothetical protein